MSNRRIRLVGYLAAALAPQRKITFFFSLTLCLLSLKTISKFRFPHAFQNINRMYYIPYIPDTMYRLTRLFSRLFLSPQELLFQSASLELFVLRLAYRTKPEDTKLTFCNGVVLALEQCQRSFGDWLHSILEFSKALHILDVDASAFACLCALTLITGKFRNPLSSFFERKHITFSSLSALPCPRFLSPPSSMIIH